jgi:phage terminase large subunit GpA-like protein
MVSLGNRALIDELWRQAAEVMLRPEPQALPNWADNNRILSRKNAAREGEWKTARVEVARGPMLAVDEPGVEIISVMVATQLLKTEFLLNTIGRCIHLDPCPILVVYPNEDAAKAFSQERLSPMVAETPVLKNLVSDPKGRNAGNTIEVKHFPGGFVAMVSAASPMNLSARPVRVVLQDEIDKYAPTKEGDPIMLAEERTSTYDEMGISLKIRCCSPTVEETSRIWSSYQASDMRRPYLKCPHCQHWQYLEFFRHVHWPKNAGQHDTAKALIYCEQCKKPWSETQRRAALREIWWNQTKTFVCCGDGQDPRGTRYWDFDITRKVGYAKCTHCHKRAVINHHAGFTASKLYSPHITMPKLAAKWIEAEKDIESRQAFYNTQLALPYKIEATKEIASKTLETRSEVWDNLPDGVLVITAGVDVQSGGDGSMGRLECEVVGWGAGEESWSLGYHAFIGDPAKPDIWNQLDKLLLEPLTRSDGRKMRILAACIDSGGHNTEDVYKYCLARTGRNIWAVKGASDRSGQWSPVWPASEFRSVRRRTRNRKTASGARYRPVIIGVNAAKEAIRQRLLIKEPGPGYCHFPAGRPSGYYDQLTAERLIIERKAGIMVRRWDLQSHRANEALDVRVYAYAALQGLINDKGFKFATVARMLARPLNDDDAEEAAAVMQPIPPAIPLQAAPPTPAPAAPPPAARQPLSARRNVVRSSSFMQRMRY